MQHHRFQAKNPDAWCGTRGYRRFRLHFQVITIVHFSEAAYYCSSFQPRKLVIVMGGP